MGKEEEHPRHLLQESVAVFVKSEKPGITLDLNSRITKSGDYPDTKFLNGSESG